MVQNKSMPSVQTYAFDSSTQTLFGQPGNSKFNEKDIAAAARFKYTTYKSSKK